MPRRGRNKYAAKRTQARDGKWFHSKKEANRYDELLLLQKEGKISGLRCQVSWQIVVNKVVITKYIADFVYWEKGAEIVEDVKGYRTREYKMKRDLMLAVHGIHILET